MTRSSPIALIANVRSFCRMHDGSVAVEFTLVVTLLLGLLFAIVETGLTFLFGLSVENATQKLARMIQTGKVQQLGVSSLADLKDKVICPTGGVGLLPAFVDCSRLIVDLRSADAYGANPTIYFYRQATQYCPGAAGHVVVLRLAYGLPVFLPPLALGNAVFGPSTAGIIDDYPEAVGWTHLLEDAIAFQIEGSASDASATSASTMPGGC